MKDLKIPESYLPKSPKSSSNEPATFERWVISEWAKSKSKKDRQAVINKAFENQKMNSYEYIISSLTLEKK